MTTRDELLKILQTEIECADRRGICSIRVDRLTDLKAHLERPSRHEVIDHRTNAPEIGRLSPDAYEFQYQDEGRTLKVFLKDVVQPESGGENG